MVVSTVQRGSQEWIHEKQDVEKLFSWNDERVIGLAHFSVKEYILSERLRTGSLSRFYVESMKAHQHLSEMCLIYLLDFSSGERLVYFGFKEFPLLAYAARYWHEHWRSARNSREQAKSRDFMFWLFDRKDLTSFINWLNISNPDRTNPGRIYSTGKSADAFPQPLYYTATLGDYSRTSI